MHTVNTLRIDRRNTNTWAAPALVAQTVRTERCPDNTAPEHQALSPVGLQHGAGGGLAVKDHAAQRGAR